MVEHLVQILGKLVAFFKKWGLEEGSSRISQLFLTIGPCRRQASPIALGRLWRRHQTANDNFVLRCSEANQEISWLAFLLAIIVWRILLRKTGMPIPGAPFRLGHCCDLYGSAVNPPGHPCGSLKKDNNVCPDRNVPQGHNHGHASRHYPSPLGLNLKSSKALCALLWCKIQNQGVVYSTVLMLISRFIQDLRGGVAIISLRSYDNVASSYASVYRLYFWNLSCLCLALLPWPQ